MRIIPGPTFQKEANRLRKKYRSINEDLRKLAAELAANPILGVSIGKSCRKIRMAITSKGKGKSGGARIIVYVAIVEDKAVLLTIYDKAERKNLEAGELDMLLGEIGY